MQRCAITKDKELQRSWGEKVFGAGLTKNNNIGPWGFIRDGKIFIGCRAHNYFCENIFTNTRRKNFR
jgi:hypothetical protein